MSDGVDGGDGDASAEEPAEAEDAEGITRCDYCRLPVPGEAITVDHEGVPYSFCCETCRTALEENDQVFTQYHGFRRLSTGVSALDKRLPHGVPRNSFVMLTDLAGTRTEALKTELAWRAVQRGEPVVFVSFLEPPVSVVQNFASLEWNLLPSLEAGDVRIIDCFTYRVEDRERMHERLNPWNTHVRRVAEEATVTVRDPSDVGEVENRLDGALEALSMQDEGIVIVDSLTELGSLLQPVQAYGFVKDVRADVCKGRFVPIFAGATVTSENERFPHDLDYMADGVVELRLNEELVENALIKQVRVRKLNGVLNVAEWDCFEYAPGRGMVTFDPIAQMEAAREEASADDGDEADAAEDGGNAAAVADEGGSTGEDTSE